MTDDLDDVSADHFGPCCETGECDDDLSDVCRIGSSGGDFVRSNLHPLCGGCSCECHRPSHFEVSDE